MKRFLSTLPRNILDCFRGWMISWHIIAIILTFSLVTSGLDWLYFTSTRDPILRSWMFPAAPIGGLVPISPGFRGGARSHIHQLYRFEKPVKFASVKRAAF